MRLHWRVWLVLASATALGCACLILGSCASARAPHVSPPPPPQDADTYAMLNLLLIPALLSIAAGVAITVWLPFKKIGLSIIAGGAALAFSVLCLHAILPYMIWIVLAILVGAAGWIIWQFYHHENALKCVIDKTTDPPKRVQKIIQRLLHKKPSRVVSSIADKPL